MHIFPNIIPYHIIYVVRWKPATLLILTLLHGCFSRFLNCTSGTKSRNASHIIYHIIYHLDWFVNKCTKFRGSCVTVGLVGLVPLCHHALVGISWFQSFFSWVFRGYKRFSRDSKIFSCWLHEKEWQKTEIHKFISKHVCDFNNYQFYLKPPSFFNFEIPTRKNLGHTKYPREKISEPRRHDDTMAWDPRWHESYRI